MLTGIPTLAPLISALQVDRRENTNRDMRDARRRLAQVGLEQIAVASSSDLTMSHLYTLEAEGKLSPASEEMFQRHSRLGLTVAGLSVERWSSVADIRAP